MHQQQKMLFEVMVEIKKMFELSSDNRAFFAKVSTATLANPFSVKRDIADNSILGVESNQAQNRLPEVVSEVSRRLKEIQSLPRWRLDQYTPGDSRLLNAAILFTIFHKYMEELINISINNKNPLKNALPSP